MNKIKAIIFDMDGTLYSFDDGNETQFTSSEFGRQIQLNCIRFFEINFGLSPNEAELLFQDFNMRYNGEVSFGVEKEFGIDRSEYFDFTWNLPVGRFITKSPVLVQTLQTLAVQSGVLTAAPKVWAEKVLSFLQIRGLFAEALFTGDLTVHKPDQQAFLQLAQFWNLEPTAILAIGDQEKTDILPAKSLGMQTLRIAKRADTQADFMAPDIITAIALLKERGII